MGRVFASYFHEVYAYFMEMLLNFCIISSCDAGTHRKESLLALFVHSSMDIMKTLSLFSHAVPLKFSEPTFKLQNISTNQKAEYKIQNTLFTP